MRQENVVPSLRELCGPHDPELARTVRPKSLRAVFGQDKAKNGVHCTDLVEDGILEVEYFFNILQKKWMILPICDIFECNNKHAKTTIS